MRYDVEFSYDVEPPDGCSHEEFAVKLQDYIHIRFGSCEVVQVFNNIGKNGELKPGWEHKFSMVLKFSTNSLANQVKQKFHGTQLYKITFFTSWWPKKHLLHQLSSDDSSAVSIRGRGRGHDKWAVGGGGRFVTSWKGSNFSLSTSHFRESRSNRQSYHEGFSSSGSGHVMFRRSDYYSASSSFSEHASQKSDRDLSPESSSSQTSLSRRRSPQRRKVTSTDTLNISPKRVRHVSMASSSSECNSEPVSDKGNNSSSSSIRSYPRITSPIRVDSDGNGEPKSEGRVLRSHSSQLASVRKKQTKSGSTPPPSQSKPTTSRYNTRSKKRSLEKEELPSPKRHQASRVKSSKVKDMGNNSIKKLGLVSSRKKDNGKSEKSVGKVVIVKQGDSSATKFMKAMGAGESSQSEDEVWVEKSVTLKKTQELQEVQNVPKGSAVKVMDKSVTGGHVAATTSDSTSVVENAADGNKQDRQNPRVKPLTVSTPELVDVLNSPNVKPEEKVVAPKMEMMLSSEDRDETPPAELLEATQHYMVQGDYSRWYKENFGDDPQAWQRYCEYYNAIMMAGRSDGHVSDANAESIQPAAAPSAEIQAPVEGASLLHHSFSATTLQRTQSMPLVSSSAKVQGKLLYERNCKSMPPELCSIESNSVPLENASKASYHPVSASSGSEIPMSVSTSSNVPESSISTRHSNIVTEKGVQVCPLDTPRSEISSQQWSPRHIRIRKNYGHLQREALQKFLNIAKPLIVSTDTLSRGSPSCENTLMSALGTSLENVSKEVVGEFLKKLGKLKNSNVSPGRDAS